MKRRQRSQKTHEYIGPHRHTEVRIRSSTAVIRALLQLRDVLYPKHFKRFLSNCLWQITQADCRTIAYDRMVQ